MERHSGDRRVDGPGNSERVKNFLDVGPSVRAAQCHRVMTMWVSHAAGARATPGCIARTQAVSADQSACPTQAQCIAMIFPHSLSKRFRRTRCCHREVGTERELTEHEPLPVLPAVNPERPRAAGLTLGQLAPDGGCRPYGGRRRGSGCSWYRSGRGQDHDRRATKRPRGGLGAYNLAHRKTGAHHGANKATPWPGISWCTSPSVKGARPGRAGLLDD